jgi:hypothetical protein
LAGRISIIETKAANKLSGGAFRKGGREEEREGGMEEERKEGRRNLD